MNRALWFALGAIAMVAAILTIGLIAAGQAGGFSAHQPPSAIEAWLARQARGTAIPAEYRARANPVPQTPEVLAEARAHWADHCAVCHANDGSGDVVMGRNMYPPAPDMRRPETQQLTDGELFYIIQNGVRLTGMPGWGGPNPDTTDARTGPAQPSANSNEGASWKLVHFIRHLPQLTFEEKKEMEKLNPKGPDDRKEEEEEERFLKGEDTDATQPEHHHH